MGGGGVLVVGGSNEPGRNKCSWLVARARACRVLHVVRGPFQSLTSLRLPSLSVKVNFLSKLKSEDNQRNPHLFLVGTQLSSAYFSGETPDLLVLDQVASSHPIKFPARRT